MVTHGDIFFETNVPFSFHFGSISVPFCPISVPFMQRPRGRGPGPWNINETKMDLKGTEMAPEWSKNGRATWNQNGTIIEKWDEHGTKLEREWNRNANK
jgi:hypothetical protein